MSEKQLKTGDLPVFVSAVIIPLLQLIMALVVSSLLVLLVGENPWQAITVLVQGAVGSAEGISYTLYYATSFIFTGLAVAIAFHAGLFNIGGEGQAYLGGLGVAAMCLMLDQYLPAIVMLPLVIIGAALFGALWALIAGYLQAKRGAHVVVTTIMLNYIAAALMNCLIVQHLSPSARFADGTRNFTESASMPKLYEMLSGLPNSLLNPTIFLALIMAFLVWYLLWRTRFGYMLRVVGQNPSAANYAGISYAKIVMLAMMLSGALAGMMAVNEVYGAQGRLTMDFTAGAGFIGIAVALMGRNHPVGIIFAAFLFGALWQGGAELQFEMPSLSRELILVIQGLVIFFTAALDQLLRRPIEQWYSLQALKANQQNNMSAEG